MAEKVQAYKANDGKLFDTKLEADMHEAYVKKNAIAQELSKNMYNKFDDDLVSVNEIYDALTSYNGLVRDLGIATDKYLKLVEKWNKKNNIGKG